MDATAQTAPRDSEIINEMLSRETHGFDSTNISLGLRNHQRTAVTGYAGIRQPKQPLGTRISPTNYCPEYRMDATAQTAPTDSEIINELLSWVTPRFDSTNSPKGLIYHQRTPIPGDAWMRQPEQPPGTHKSSTNCCHG
jgi:hypothetical protein